MSAPNQRVNIREEFATELRYVEAARVTAYKARGRVMLILFFFVLLSLGIAYTMMKISDTDMFAFIFLVIAVFGGMGIYQQYYVKYQDQFRYAYKHLLMAFEPPKPIMI